MGLMKLPRLSRRSQTRASGRVTTEDALKRLPQRPLGPVLPGFRILRRNGHPDRAF